MFKPEADRLEYGSELLPPEGFHLVRAVATTYSLDFETLIAVLVPLALSGDVEDKELYSNPLAILQAIRKVIGKLVVFCEAGQIKVPAVKNRLAALLDDIVVQVALPRKGRHYPSFHPKTWLIEYENAKGEHLWKFIVLSRNLTKDRSWDVAVSFDGELRTGSYGATKDLIPFYEFLRSRVYKGQGKESQWKVVNDAIGALEGVSFFCTDPFYAFDFFPMGVSSSGKTFDIFKADEAFDDLVVISPFLTPGLIRRLNGDEDDKRERRRILVSRAESLGKLKPSDADRFRKYIIRTLGIESEDRHDLHAKVYLRRRGSQTELWVGSANATESGTASNVEMMVCLYCYNRHLNAEKLMADICGGDPAGKASPFEEIVDVGEYSAEETAEEAARKAAEEKIKVICRMGITGAAVEDGVKYRLSLSFPRAFDGRGVFVYPINAPGNKVEVSGEAEVRFQNSMEVEDLSELFAFSVPYDGGVLERVVKLNVSGIPETRNDAVLNRVVKDRPSLLRYLAMLLSSSPALSLSPLEDFGALLSGGDGCGSAESLMPGLYEEMLAAAVSSPERIREVGNVIGRIKRDDEFLEQYGKVYDCFAKVLGIRSAEGRGK